MKKFDFISIVRHWTARYLVAIALPVAAALVRWVFLAGLGNRATYVTFFPAVIVAALYGGLWPGLMATALSAALADYFWIEPRGFSIADPADLLSLIVFILSGGLISAITGRMHRVQARAAQMETQAKEAAAREQAEETIRRQREWVRVTLTSIGDAVIAADTARHITFLNPVATALTGWGVEEARGQPVEKVFRIIDEETRQPAEDIVGRVLGEGKIIMLADHNALVGRDGREIPVEDSAAPIKDSTGAVIGVVVVFHDVTEKRRAQELLRQSEQRIRLKLESILSPEGDIAKLELGEVIDVQAVQSLMDGFYAVAHIPMAMIDLKGKVLVRVGWQDVCTRFHRVQPEACQHCLESDTMLSAGVLSGEFKLYKCKNNLWDAATPIQVGGQHLGNLFTGQFFLEDEPFDRDLFRAQAAKYGFDEAEYLAALDRIPRLSREFVNAAMSSFLKLADLISKLSFSNIKLARSLTERDRSEAELRRLNRTLTALSKSSQTMMRADKEQHYLDDVCQILARDCGHKMVWIGFAEEDEGKSIRPVAYAGFEKGYLETLDLSWADTERGRGPTGTAIRTGKPCHCRDMLHDPLFDLWREEALKRGYSSSLVVPLLSDGKAFGAITIYSAQPDAFAEEEVKLLSELADDLAYGIQAVRLQAEHSRAEEALRTSEARYRTLFETMTEGFSLYEILCDEAGKARDFRYLAVNPAFERQTGLKAEAVVGRTARELFPQTEPLWFECCSKVAVTGEPAQFEVRLGPLGQWFEVMAFQTEPRRFAMLFLDITERKLAQQALSEINQELEQRIGERTAEVRAASRYTRNLLEASLDPLVAISHEGVITDVNRATELATGVAREQLIGSSFAGCFTEPEKADAGYQEVITEGFVRDYPLTIRHVSGRTIDVLYNATVYRNEAGEVQGVFAAARDITERKEAERRREFTSALLALFIHKSSLSDYLNSVVETIRQWSGSQAIGIRLRNDREEIPYESWAGFEPAFVELEGRLSLQRDNCCCIRAINGAYEEQDREMLTAGGSYRCDDVGATLSRLAPEKQTRYRGNCMKFGFASLAVIPVFYRDEVIGAIHLADRRPARFPPDMIEFIESMTPLIGEAVHRFQTEAELARHRDHLEVLVKQRTGELEAANARLQVEITERKHAQETLQHTAEDLKRSNRDLEQFAYVASHDLQEPLRAVAGYVKLLHRRFPQDIDAKALEFITGAADGAARMERLITDLLTFSRVGTRGGAFVSTNLDRLLSEALQNLHASIKAAGAKVTSDPLPTLTVDPTQIMQLFQNLIGNAIKFRGGCPPQIHVGAQKQPDRWVFSVRDNGIGIDPQYFDRIFQIFQRLHTRKYYSGTGIGLAICKRIAERHGGLIWVESQPDHGSTFSFSIPLGEIHEGHSLQAAHVET
jgi:PAS domain S-box-containing protein